MSREGSGDTLPLGDEDEEDPYGGSTDEEGMETDEVGKRCNERCPLPHADGLYET